MNKYVILNVTKNTKSISKVAKQHFSIKFETINNIEQAIEKLHNLSANVIFIDKFISEEDVEKIQKIGKLLQPDVIIRLVDFNNQNEYDQLIVKLRKEYFKQKMTRYTFEDNPNLNNPFLNLDKTNIFN